MKCERCGTTIPDGEERDWHGEVLCEDCYMDAISPPRMCDPWAVHTAKSFAKEGDGPELNEIQQEILRLLEETGGMEPAELFERVGVDPSRLQRELAALRHMEKVRAELREGKRVLRLW